MKKLDLGIGIAACVLVAVGCALVAAGSIMLAMDNAAYDYYNGTSRQLFGWILCFAPLVLAAGGAAVVLLRKKLGAVAIFGVCGLVVAAFLPFVYMAMHGELLMLILIGAVAWLVSALGILIADSFLAKRL